MTGEGRTMLATTPRTPSTDGATPKETSVPLWPPIVEQASAT
eukprot:CAMPEP_0201676946 /NCGR_PEP_ID=MMETSP0494-20130426/43018_1 /ASSEMBLY_ACC=CAM_ASM_000839 /TAXON_ID=420259 /ORGANISM="Thalassiosira gravida, Strain GMp14c1" /LENGTH=41 /DNA_ID= /DNA_START= /DNA_END= /DNA_ORIENTATION=